MTATLPGLVHLCTVDLELAPVTSIGDGPAGRRLVAGIDAMRLHGSRLNASLEGRTAADWLTLAAGVATIDVRATVRTDDGALVYLQYHGRSDASNGFGTAPVFVAVTFETSDPRYQWLNHTQATGKGVVSERRYEWYQLT